MAEAVIGPATDMTDVAFIVCTALHRVGTRAILTGGSAATVYAPDAYQSADLDFVLEFTAEVGSGAALAELGYSVQGTSYVHESNPFTIDLIRHDLMVGADRIEGHDTMTRGEHVLYILSPTDSVRDRLASFYWFKDYTALAAAIAVAIRRPVDMQTIEAWSDREGETERFREFERRLRARQEFS